MPSEQFFSEHPVGKGEPACLNQNMYKVKAARKIKAEYTNLLGPVGLKKKKKREKTNYTNLPIQWGKLTLNWKTTATLLHRT